MELSEYPDSFKESEDFADIQKNPFRQISANLIDAVAKYIKSIFQDYGVSNKDFNTFFDLFASFDMLSFLFKNFVNEYI